MNFLPKTALLLIVFLAPIQVWGYAADTTHPALTSETVGFFNYHYPELALTSEERALLMRGSTEEDHPLARVIHHFYDPVYKTGFSYLGLKGMPAIEWAENTLAQARFSLSPSNFATGITSEPFSADTDYSWGRAVYEYAHGDKARALEALGHILHLIQDVSVPDHTRNDPHPPVNDFESPYEAWTSQFAPNNFSAASSLIEEGQEIVLLPVLSEHFERLASFSNNNFFSKDTVPFAGHIPADKYPIPNFDLVGIGRLTSGEIQSFGMVELEGQRYKLFELRERRNTITGEHSREYLIQSDGTNNLIVQDYWNILSKQAVLHGAGVIKLFFDGVEKERESLALHDKNRSWFNKLAEAALPFLRRYAAPPNTATQLANVGQADSNQPDVQEPVDVAGEDSEPVVLASEDTQEVLDTDEFADIAPEPSEEETSEEAAETEASENIEGSEEEGGNEAGKTDESAASSEESEEETGLFSDAPNVIGTPGVPVSGGGPPRTEQEEQEEPAGRPDAPVVITPQAATLYATTTIVFSGTATASTTVATDFASTTAAVDENGEWELSLSGFLEGTTTVSFFVHDDSGQKSDATSLDVAVDVTPPEVSFEVPACGYSLVSGKCAQVSETAELSWSAVSSDVSHIGWIRDGAIIATTTATSTEISIDVGETDVGVVAYDKAGNSATSTIETVMRLARPVVINEIAWAGTAASAGDEWLELYNNSSETIDLSNVVLAAEDGVPYLKLSGSLNANDYFLIERTDDSATSEDADMAVPFSGIGSSSGLSNSGEELQLLHVMGEIGTSTIDTTPTVATCGGWCAGESETPLSMERSNPDEDGALESSWESNNTFTKNGTDSNGEAIEGTPKSKNSTNLHAIGYYCRPYEESFEEGGYYEPTGDLCTYISETIPGKKYAFLFRGAVGSSTLVISHFIGKSSVQFESYEFLNEVPDVEQGEDFFAAIFTSSFLETSYTADFKAFFESGSTSPPHLDYGVLPWKYGVAP